VRGDWKGRGGQLIPGKGPEWMGIATMSKTSAFQAGGVFLSPLTQGVMPRTVDYMLCKYKDRILCQHHHAFNSLEMSSW
jgi:hypothetical protein